ncbi:uncharacterized protein LOC115961271 [Quercus lobata]|uniref:uncharacterized protein LOC115961271 n=1 Tax=Quercus lobata TaxID=97700 RepID=UPI00124423C5|nr:uncharacterized protein LOC115961271 [Quercus lobata]
MDGTLFAAENTAGLGVVIRDEHGQPPWGWLKLNSNGSAINNTGKAGGGGLFHDHEGNWVKGYVRGIGHTNSFMAELWALRDRLNIAREMGVSNLIIELGALSIVLLMNNEAENIMMEPLLFDCRSLSKQIPNKRVLHVYREAN